VNREGSHLLGTNPNLTKPALNQSNHTLGACFNPSFVICKQEICRWLQTQEAEPYTLLHPKDHLGKHLMMSNCLIGHLLVIAKVNTVLTVTSFCDLEILIIRSKFDMNAFHVAAKRGHLGIFFLSFFFHSFLVL
jgi:hypothetical protein